MKCPAATALCTTAATGRKRRTQRFRTKSFCHCLGTVDPFRDCRKNVNGFIHHLLRST